MNENSWVGKSIRKGLKLGKVIHDANGIFRVLRVRFEDGTEEEIWMANMGNDPESVHQYEWLNNDKWYRF